MLALAAEAENGEIQDFAIAIVLGSVWKFECHRRIDVFRCDGKAKFLKSLRWVCCTVVPTASHFATNSFSKQNLADGELDWSYSRPYKPRHILAAMKKLRNRVLEVLAEQGARGN